MIQAHKLCVISKIVSRLLISIGQNELLESFSSFAIEELIIWFDWSHITDDFRYDSSESEEEPTKQPTPPPIPSSKDMDLDSIARSAARCIPSLRFIYLHAEHPNECYWGVRGEGDITENLTKLSRDEGRKKSRESVPCFHRF